MEGSAPSGREPVSIDRARARTLVRGGAQVLDVLSAGEHAEVWLPGAVNVPLKKLSQATAGALDPDAPVVVYCHDST